MSDLNEDDVSLPTMKTPKDRKDGIWSVQNKRLLFTYKGHLDKCRLFDMFKELEGGKKFTFWRAAHEIGTSNEGDYKHTHVLVDFGYKRQTKNVRLWDYIDLEDPEEENVHPNIQLVTTNAHWENCKKYIAKEDPENNDLKDPEPVLFDNITRQETLTAALRTARKPTDFAGIEKAYSYRDRRPTLDIPGLYPWQENLFKEFEASKDKRKIFWVYDTVGSIGKSELIRYMLITLGTRKVLSLACVVNSYHGATIVQKSDAKGWDGGYMVIDIPRKTKSEDLEGLYSFLEQVKNGMVTAMKFSGETIILSQRTQILIFANLLPDFKAMTQDRWDIRTPEGESHQVQSPEGGWYFQYKNRETLRIVPYKPEPPPKLIIFGKEFENIPRYPSPQPGDPPT